MEDNTEDVGLTDFDLAFEAAAGLGDGAEDTAQDEGTADVGAGEGEGTAAAEGTAADTAAKEAADKAAQEAADAAAKEEADKVAAEAEAKRVADEAAAKDTKPPVVDPAKEAADAAAKLEADRVAKEAADKAAADAAAKEQFTDADQEVLARTAEDFPDVAKAFEIRERVLLAKIENLLSGKLGQLTSQFEQRLAPVLPVVQDYAQSAFSLAITKVHPDAYQILPQVEAWVGTQPKFIQDRMNTILDGGYKGAIEDTIELFSVFKKANVVEGAHSDDQAKLEADNAAKAAAEADREKKLKAQEGVRSRQTAQKSSIDENDFEGAFALAANS